MESFQSVKKVLDKPLDKIKTTIEYYDEENRKLIQKQNQQIHCLQNDVDNLKRDIRKSLGIIDYLQKENNRLRMEIVNQNKHKPKFKSDVVSKSEIIPKTTRKRDRFSSQHLYHKLLPPSKKRKLSNTDLNTNSKCILFSPLVNKSYNNELRNIQKPANCHLAMIVNKIQIETILYT